MEGFDVKPLTPERWRDLEELFGPRGACSGCWCMWFRIKRGEWTANGSQGNRAALKAIVDAGREPGLLGYLGSRPVAWCSLGPREEYPVLDRSPATRRMDAAEVWSLVCFFTAPGMRGQGLGRAMLEAAVDHARSRGARILEAYPVDSQRKITNAEAFHGTPALLGSAGFVEIARHRPTRPVMRLLL